MGQNSYYNFTLFSLVASSLTARFIVLDWKHARE